MKFHSLFLTALTALSLTLGGCSNDDAIKNPDGDGDGMKITFSIGIAGSSDDGLSRAATDGEDYDIGLSGEREVNNVMIVVYDRPINYAYDGGKVLKVFYLENPGPFTPSTDKSSPSYFDPMPSYYPQTDVLNRITVGTTVLSDVCKQEFKVEDESPLEVGKRYYATALCNFGDMSSTFKNMTLKEFRDYIYTGNLYDRIDQNIREYKNFRMTGINEESFIWERKTEGSVDLGSFLVQRLAARVDVTFGEPQTEFINQASYITDGYIDLAVYTEDGNNNFVINKDATGNPKNHFYFTDIKIVRDIDPVNNDENSKRSGVYLIERSSPFSPAYRDDKNNPAVPVYFDNEGWVGFSNHNRKATKFIYSPASNQIKKSEYSLTNESGYSNLPALIKGGVFFNDEGTDADKYYANKKKSSVVGYIREHTCSENNYTVVRIEGYTDANTSDIFTGSRALNTTGLTHVVGDIPIMHNLDANSHVMDYAVVRNTIYRLRIKVVATEKNIYFRYYYVEPGKTNQKEYVVACFQKEVQNNEINNPSIND